MTTATEQAPISISRKRSARQRQAVAHRVLMVLFGIFVLVGWELACRTLHISELLLPAPSQIVDALIGGFRTGLFTAGLEATLVEVILGFIVAAVAAFVCGVFD